MAPKESKEKEVKKVPEAQFSKEEKIGFHKGALATLTKEREELMRILQIVEQLMQMHIKELKEVGIDLVAQAKDAKKLKGQKPIEDVLEKD